MLIKIQPDAKVCRYLFTAKSLYMCRVSQHPSSGVLKTVTAASLAGHNTGTATCLQRGLIGQMKSTMTLLKRLNNPNLLLPCEQYYIQSLHHESKLIPEQSPGEINPLFQKVINPNPPHST